MTGDTIEIGRLEPRDGEALRNIYNYYVDNTAVTFDVGPRDERQWAEWMAKFADAGRHQCFVARDRGVAIGWASSSQFKPRAAYDTSVETSVYLTPGRERGGIGRRLYARLFDALAREDVHRAFAGITAPNPGSVRLHEIFGFRYVGTFPEVGRKFDGYHDVEWYWRPVPLDRS